MMTVEGLTLSLATGSDALEGVVVDDLKTGTEIGYADQIGDVTSLLVLNIFTLGIIAGLIMGVIFWRKMQ